LVKDGQSRGSAVYKVDRRNTPTKKNSPDLAHFILRIGNFCLSLFLYIFSPTLPSPLGLGYDPEDDITGQDNWMTVDLPEASDRSRPIA